MRCEILVQPAHSVLFQWACSGNLRPPSASHFSPVVVGGGGWRGLTTTQGLDVAMSASVPVVHFYVVYRGVQREKTKRFLGSVSRTLHPCDSTHMEAASSAATGRFLCLVPGCGATVAMLPSAWRGWRMGAAGQSNEPERISPAPLRGGRCSSGEVCHQLPTAVPS